MVSIGNVIFLHTSSKIIHTLHKTFSVGAKFRYDPFIVYLPKNMMNICYNMLVKVDTFCRFLFQKDIRLRERKAF